MVVVGLAFVVCIVGLLVYVMVGSEHPKAQELGRIAYAMGLLAFLLQASQAVSLVVK